MTTECRHALPNGQKCRCAATRNQKFCRHHGPKADPARNGAAAVPKNERYSRIRRWSALNRVLPSIDQAEIPFEAYSIFEALLRDGETGISDREAGRLLRSLFRRYGSVPFPFPSEPDDLSPAVTAAQPPHAQSPQPRSPVSCDNDRLLKFIAELGSLDPDLDDASLLASWQQLTATRPSLIQTRPSSHQTQPRLNQTRPTAK
jgi:hypothetical protein